MPTPRGDVGFNGFEHSWADVGVLDLRMHDDPVQAIRSLRERHLAVTRKTDQFSRTLPHQCQVRIRRLGLRSASRTTSLPTRISLSENVGRFAANIAASPSTSACRNPRTCKESIRL